MAKEDYVRAVNIETWLIFRGSYRHDRVPIFGRSLILDARGHYFLIYFDGEVLTIGEQALILGTEFICEYTNTAPQLSELTVVNEPMESLLAGIPNDVLMSGELAANKRFQATSPTYTSNDFPIVKVMSGRIEFEYAVKKEIASLNVRVPEDIRTLQTHVRKLEEDIQNISVDIDSLAEKRSREKELLFRYELQNDIAELKTKKKAMERSLETRQSQLTDYGTANIGFSGRLSLRKLPLPAHER